MRRIGLVLIALALSAPTVAAGDTLAERTDVARNAPGAQPRLGAVVIPLTPELRAYFGAPPDRGVLVARVLPDTPATDNLHVGDVITDVGGAPITDAPDVWNALASQHAGDLVKVAVVRDHQATALTARLEADSRSALELFRLMPWVPWAPPTA
jgi:S1-C subfamily serine protease